MSSKPNKLDATTDAFALSRALRAIFPFASKDGMRPHLTTVCFGVRKSGSKAHYLDLVTTHGHVLARARLLDCEIASATPGDYVVEAAKLRRVEPLIRPPKRGDSLRTRIVVTRGHLSVTTHDGTTFSIPRSTEEFPPYEKVLPEVPDRSKQVSSMVGCNAKYLSQIGTAANTLGAMSLRIYRTGGELDVIYIHADDPSVGDLDVALMPCKMDDPVVRHAS